MDTGLVYMEYYKAQQELEEKYGSESIILMMVGSFYEMYGVDLPNEKPTVKIGKVEEAHNTLGMNMTRKDKSRPHSRNNPYMVGFPDYALDEHLGKLLRANLTVGIYDQYNIPGKKKKGRKLAHVYTPSTFIDDTLPDAQCLLVFELSTFSTISKQQLQKVHIAVLSLDTGKVNLLEAYDRPEDTGRAESELYRIIHSYNPSEIISGGVLDPKFSKIYDLGTKKIYHREIPKVYRKPSYQAEFIKKIYHSRIEQLDLDHHTSLIPHLIHALQYAYEQDKLIVTRIQTPKIIETRNHLILNNDSIYQLNLVRSPIDSSNTLYDIVCKARTAMGKRKIRERLLSPNIDPQTINQSYDLIEQMQPVYQDYEPLLCEIADIEKKYRKMVLGTLHPYEFADLRGTWKAITKVLQLGQQLFGISLDLIDRFECFYNEYRGHFNFAVMKRCKLTDIRGSFFLPGVNSELDSIAESTAMGLGLFQTLAQEMSAHIDSEKAVRVDYTDKEGWYLTTTNARFKKLSEFQTSYRYQGLTYRLTYNDLELTRLKNSVKIRSGHLNKVSHFLLRMKEELGKKVLEEYQKSLNHYVEEYGDLFTSVADLIAQIDYTYSAAKVALINGYVRPKIVDREAGKSFVEIKDIRHPIVEQINESEEYTTNDLELGRKDHFGSIIYGLNMSGKSTLLKAVGCNLVLAQAGLFTSCSKMRYFPFRNLLSKMTIRDNMAKGQSTFMVEMLEVKNMLMRSSPQTLVLSDELCSSTESVSAHALVAQTLHTLTEKGSKFLFSTHLHDLQNLKTLTDNPYIQIYHFKVHISREEIKFDRRLELGGMSELYGIEVARALGLPTEFIRGAFEARDILLDGPRELLSNKQSRYNKDLYMDHCMKCGATHGLHTHHLRHQKDADAHGLIESKFHKNKKFNLQVLCGDCHTAVHSGNCE
jgi:DNA mismatch repair protein MutS